MQEKHLNIGPKLLYFGIFEQELEKLLYCGILHQHPQFFRNTKSCPKIKIPKFIIKIALIGYFGLGFQKTNVVFEINILEFVTMQSSTKKQKSFKVETKNILLGIFRL